MSVVFNQVPNNIRVPFVYIEFDNSKSELGPSIQPYKILVLGQRLADGTKQANELVRITSEPQAKQFFGAGSQIASSIATLLENNRVTEVIAMAQDDANGSRAATGSLNLGEAPAESGSLNVYIGGRRYSVPVAKEQALNAIAESLVEEIEADANRITTAQVNDNDETIINLTARNKGEAGNEIDLRLNYFDGEALPAGLIAEIGEMENGRTNPDLTEAIALLGEEQYNIIVMPYTDQANLTLMENELADRFGPIRQNDGVMIAAKRASFANLGTLGDSRNSPHLCIMGAAGPMSPWEWSSAVAGQVAISAQNDPARPFQTLELRGILPPDESERFDLTERNLLLFDGISTYRVDPAGKIRIERLITTFKQNAFGAPDTSFLDLNTVLTLSYLRYDFRNHFLRKFPRHKLANDGVRFGPGQQVITPKIAKAETIAKFRQWEDLGLVENLDQFKRDLIVERNNADPNRLDILIPPDLVNQLRIIGTQISFLR